MTNLSNKKIKSIAARGRMMKARCHIGRNGLQQKTKKTFLQAFEGNCIRPDPSDVVRVKVHSTFSGDVNELVRLFEELGAVFIVKEGPFMTFWKPGM